MEKIMSFTFEETLLISLNEKMDDIFYLTELAEAMMDSECCDGITLNDIEFSAYQILQVYEKESEPIIQSLQVEPEGENIYRKLFTETDEDTFLKSKGLIPSLSCQLELVRRYKELDMTLTSLKDKAAICYEVANRFNLHKDVTLLMLSGYEPKIYKIKAEIEVLHRLNRKVTEILKAEDKHEKLSDVLVQTRLCSSVSK
tara:strand:+ start:5527 stop:6126 length:600 start_codon:yes stop_codon:yes gene_type:complete